MTHNRTKEEVPFPLILGGFSRIIDLGDGVLEITDEEGASVYAMHCQLSCCGQPMFSKRKRLFYVCKDCVLAAEKVRNRQEVYCETRRCFCGNDFQWSTSMKRRKYCSRKCCVRAAWAKRRSRI
jgi:hypothetical protein